MEERPDERFRLPTEHPVHVALRRFGDLALQSIGDKKGFIESGRTRCPFCKNLHKLKKAEVHATLRGLAISLPKKRPRGRPPKAEEKPPFEIVKVGLLEDADKLVILVEGTLK